MAHPKQRRKKTGTFQTKRLLQPVNFCSTQNTKKTTRQTWISWLEASPWIIPEFPFLTTTQKHSLHTHFTHLPPQVSTSQSSSTQTKQTHTSVTRLETCGKKTDIIKRNTISKPKTLVCTHIDRQPQLQASSTNQKPLTGQRERESERTWGVVFHCPNGCTTRA